MGATERREERVRNQHLNYTPNAPVHGLWTYTRGDPRVTRTMDMFIGNGSWLKGNRFYDNARRPFVAVGNLAIKHDYLKDLDVEDRLVWGLGAAATHAYGIPRLRKFVKYPGMLDILANMVWDEMDDRFQLGSVVRKDGTKDDPPEDYEAARALLPESKGFIRQVVGEVFGDESEVMGVHVLLDLEDMDMSGREMPRLPSGPAPVRHIRDPQSRIQRIA